ncbi:hypothetical protein ANCCAN_19278 [Ancylostoma caninum]|uniref:Uncharacterized protein n=1 Tax=Ancylostoma caninum TaxID=29170 RepID=A0A368FRL6_ANCCA|nr:hypothetical protein ANCCAN_19278 [Ancylostoma caninum]
MEEAKEELEAALLQAKNQCIAIQQQVWDHDKDNLLQGEDIYVKRFLYAVTVARRTRFYNGVSCTDIPRAASTGKCHVTGSDQVSLCATFVLQRQHPFEEKWLKSQHGPVHTLRFAYQHRWNVCVFLALPRF